MLFEIIRILFPKTYDYIFKLGVDHGIYEERVRAAEERAKIQRFTQEQWINKEVIIISNEWEDPLIGTMIGLEDFGRNEAHLIVMNALTDETVISFGKVIPFSTDNLKAVVQMTPWVRWEIMTGQKIHSAAPENVYLKSFQQLMVELDEKGFFGLETNQTSTSSS